MARVGAQEQQDRKGRGRDGFDEQSDDFHVFLLAWTLRELTSTLGVEKLLSPIPSLVISWHLVSAADPYSASLLFFLRVSFLHLSSMRDSGT